jgi:hypothetical protein
MRSRWAGRSSWTGAESAFLKDKSANYFTEFFEAPAEIQGVPILYAPTSALADASSTPREIGVTAARLALQQGSDDPVLVIRDYHGLERLNLKGAASSNFWRLKDFYRYRPTRFRQAGDRAIRGERVQETHSSLV